ncbi:MAG TPA: ribonuclease T [Gammaproteobacteria bacterium]|nr:ribonuclease T [Gammaproteobacteria bacterium]
MYQAGKNTKMCDRFRGYIPVVIDVETGGFNCKTDALLELAAVMLRINDEGYIEPYQTISTHVVPFDGANIDEKSLEINGIDPWHPLRAARTEVDALGFVFTPIRKAVKEAGCTRAILVGHNAFFDLSFLNAAVERTGIRRNPFHPFSNFDTVTLSALALGQTVLARSVRAAGLEWNTDDAHSAVYDTRKTAELFCHIINRWEDLHKT